MYNVPPQAPQQLNIDQDDLLFSLEESKQANQAFNEAPIMSQNIAPMSQNFNSFGQNQNRAINKAHFMDDDFAFAAEPNAASNIRKEVFNKE